MIIRNGRVLLKDGIADIVLLQVPNEHTTSKAALKRFQKAAFPYPTTDIRKVEYDGKGMVIYLDNLSNKAELRSVIIPTGTVMHRTDHPGTTRPTQSAYVGYIKMGIVANKVQLHEDVLGDSVLPVRFWIRRLTRPEYKDILFGRLCIEGVSNGDKKEEK